MNLVFVINIILSLYFVGTCCGENTIGVIRDSGFSSVPLKSRLSTRDGRIKFGIDTSTNVYEAVCWYEFLKNFVPKTRSLDFNQCHGQASFQRKIVLKHGADEKYFGQFLLEYGMRLLPQEYMQCSHYLLEDRYSRPVKMYSHILNDSVVIPGDVQYPYQAFPHCLLSVMHDKHKSEKALYEIREKLARPKDWGITMLERENEFRALHKASSLSISDELTVRAAKWASQLARDCQMYHIHSSHPDYHLNGSRMGENLFTGDSIGSPEEDMALFGTNIWYEEIDYYPWPEYKGFGQEPFPKFSHFSQMIWKETRAVGYGFAVNSSENCGRYFIVSRYFPPGNFWERFGDNILPRVNLSTSV